MDKKKEDKWTKQRLVDLFNKAAQVSSGEFHENEAKELYKEIEKIPNKEYLDKNLINKYNPLIDKAKGVIIRNVDKFVPTETLQRLQAEFENYEKRIDKEKEDFVKYAKHEMIAKILPILDSFELALKNCKIDKDALKGFELIFSQLYSTLEAEGLRPIEAFGKKFDPYKHEVLMQEISDKEEGLVLEELQKGYMLNDKVLRHSKVKVAKKREKKK